MKRKLVFICLMGILVTLTVNAQPKIVAHRGYWDIEGSAQNSIRALIKADSIQCDACEFDVWLTADKKLVVNHDDHINGYVIETTSSDTILNQKLKNGEYLPSLDGEYQGLVYQPSIVVGTPHPGIFPARRRICGSCDG